MLCIEVLLFVYSSCSLENSDVESMFFVYKLPEVLI